MLKKILIVTLLFSLYSYYVDNNSVEYSSTLTHNVQEDVFSGIKEAGNFISTNIINDETKYYTKEMIGNGLNIIKTVTKNIINSIKFNIPKDENTPKTSDI